MKIQYGALLISTVLLLQGCGHGALEKRLDAKIEAESQIKTRADVTREARDSILGVPGLSQNQRSALLELREATRAQMDSFTVQSLRLRSVLVKDLISTAYDENEVQLIKNRIRDLEDKRVSAIFDGVDEANRILGRKNWKNWRAMEDFLEMPDGYID